MMAGAAEENVLIIAVKAGDQRAFGQLVEKYKEYVFTLALHYVRNREIAEELAQDVFVKAYRFLPGFEGKSKFSTWLYTIVHSVCLSYLRSHPGVILVTGDEALRQSDISAPSGSDPDKSHWQARISEALSKIPAEDSRVITLFYLAEQSVLEISQITGMSAANVKVRLYRARQRLRELLANDYKEYQS